MKDINVIEKNQRQAARFVIDNFSTYASVRQMLADLNWPTLVLMQKRTKAVIFLSGLVDVSANTPVSMLLEFLPKHAIDSRDTDKFK